MELINVNGQDFEVLEVHKKKCESQDVFVCKNVKFGYKECFQRYDIYGLPRNHVRERNLGEKLTNEDIKNIREKIKNGMSRGQIIEEYKGHSFTQVVNTVKEARQDFNIKDKQHYNGGKISRKVRQYDINMNFIAEFVNSTVAGRTLNVATNRIRECCSKPTHKAGGFYWRWADDE